MTGFITDISAFDECQTALASAYLLTILKDDFKLIITNIISFTTITNNKMVPMNDDTTQKMSRYITNTDDVRIRKPFFRQFVTNILYKMIININTYNITYHDRHFYLI